jgi:hypothetical protein
MQILARDRYQTITPFISALNAYWKILYDEVRDRSQGGADSHEHIDTSETMKSQKIENFNFVEAPLLGSRYDADGYVNVLMWNQLKYLGIIYRVVRKYRSRPQNLTDGDFWILNNPLNSEAMLEFYDRGVENGIPAYYAIYAIRDSTIAKCGYDLPPIMRVDDVCGFDFVKEDRGTLLKFQLPKNVKRIILKKSLGKCPATPFEGITVIEQNIPKGVESYEVLDSDPGRLPVFYAVFCQYQADRTKLRTSKGVSLLI